VVGGSSLLMALSILLQPSIANTMEPYHIKQIKLELEKEAKLSVNKLVFEIPGSPPFDIIPYLGEGPKAQEKLSFGHPRHMMQKQLASCFKI
jgi:hypothetical protein